MKHLGFDLILLGAPASGKDTQAEILMREFSLRPVETGKQLRRLVKKNDERGQALRKTFGLGHPAPVEIIKWILSNKVKQASKERSLIFIGNPRLKPEAQFLVKMMKQKKRDFFAIYISLSDKEIFQRSVQRIRMEKEGQAQYIKNRIKFTKNQVSKTIAYFKSLDKIRIVDGNQPVEQVTASINKIIDDYKKSR